MTSSDETRRRLEKLVNELPCGHTIVGRTPPCRGCIVDVALALIAEARLEQDIQRLIWASLKVQEHGCTACRFKQDGSRACMEAESENIRKIYELVRAEARGEKP